MRIQADARALPLRDATVQCVVTSPPYWGLRDYGTATWEGGDPACSHKGPPQQSQRSTLVGNGHGNGKCLSPALQAQAVPYKDVCGNCGAQRVDAQIGLEPTPDAYVETLVAVFREVRRVLRDDGTVWLNLGDSYCGGNTGNQSNVGQRYGKDKTETGHVFRRDGAFASSIGLKPKDLIGIPWRVAFAFQADGWWLRSDVIWSKANGLPESVRDRPTRAHEHVFLLTKSATYYYDADAIREPSVELAREQTDRRRAMRMNRGVIAVPGGGQTSKGVDGGEDPTHTMRTHPNGVNKRSVWHLPTQPYRGAHFAVMPEKLVEPCILAGTRPGDLVLDPFCGSGTVMRVAYRYGRRGVGCDLNETYLDMAGQRTRVTLGLPLEAV